MEEKAYYEYADIEKGIDWDLTACLHENPQDGFGLPDIDKVLAVYQGEGDERDWVWILRLIDKRMVYLQGGCDYTGWDCQSSAKSTFIDTPKQAIDLVGTYNPESYNQPYVEAVRLKIIEQLASGQKSKTWRERMNKEFGLVG